jgi:hypothetical protein
MRPTHAGLAVGFFCLCGCIPYVLPSLEVTGPLDLAEAAGEVHVFRVEVATKTGRPCYGSEGHSLSRIPLRGGVVPPQVQAGLDRGVIIIGVALNYHFHYHDGVLVRLYRPGYELVQFRSWQIGKKLEWTPVADLAGREKAIDDLLDGCGTVNNCWPAAERLTGTAAWDVPGGLRPGSHSEAHRATLAFAASEYERLLQTTATECDEAVTRRLLDKAEKVRALMTK